MQALPCCSRRFGTLACLLLCACGVPLGAPAQNLLPNPGFEEGTDKPAGWQAPERQAAWSDQARTGRRALMVEGTGRDSVAWQTARLPFTPGGLYRLRFHARRAAGASGGCIVSGPSRVNHDFRPDDSWQPFSFVFSVPHDVTSDYVRLGHWETKGQVFFDDVALLPVQVSHAHAPVGELGEGESVRAGAYRFQPNYGWEGANYHRVLALNRAGYNSDRWGFSSGSELVYRLGAGTQEQRGAKVTVQVNYHTGGQLRLEASRTPDRWTPVATFDGARRGGTVDVPPALFPAQVVFVRLLGEGAACNLQVNTFSYEAPLAGSPPDAEGRTLFLEVVESSPQVTVVLRSILPRFGEGLVTCVLDVSNRTQNALETSVKLDGVPQRAGARDRALISAGGTASLAPLAVVPQPGKHPLGIRLVDPTGRTLFQGRTEVRLGFLDDPRVGYWLPDAGRVALRWCESGWKTARYAPAPNRPPDAPTRPVSVSAARGEHEAVQIILSPAAAGTLHSVQAGAWRDRQGGPAAITVQVCEVTYLKVTHPTDESSEPDWYPDPLPPLKTPLSLRAGENTVLWVAFHVPNDTKPGAYTSELALRIDDATVRVPLAVQVYDFELPRETHLRSALGLGTHEINRYHTLTRPEDRQAVYEKYLKNFADHRISPYSFFDHAPIDIRFVGQGTNQQAKVDFTKFDQAAAKWLDEHRLNSFLLPLRGMGGGTFHSRHLGSLEGFQEGTPEFARLFGDYLGQIERHLRERGWLDKAYTYWFDEPDPKDYQFVVDGMKRIRAAAPGLRRMLTEQPEKELQGQVEIWCGLTPEWTREKVAARRAAGEEVWWYLCTGPKAPYVTIFIDHPGTEMRLWPWQSWQYGVQGILVWATIYWNSPAAFPNTLQNPWTDPMSYVSGYDFKAGHVGYWGNGDGRFLYPPRRDPNAATEPDLEAPINSIRWENLRDGMEDYEYFWLLERELQRVEGLKREPALTREAQGLLLVPEAISKDLTHFTTDPRPLLEHRDRLARMIARLQAVR